MKKTNRIISIISIVLVAVMISLGESLHMKYKLKEKDDIYNRGYTGRSIYKYQEVRIDGVLYCFKMDTITCTIISYHECNKHESNDSIE